MCCARVGVCVCVHAPMCVYVCVCVWKSALFHGITSHCTGTFAGMDDRSCFFQPLIAVRVLPRVGLWIPLSVSAPCMAFFGLCLCLCVHTRACLRISSCLSVHVFTCARVHLRNVLHISSASYRRHARRSVVIRQQANFAQELAEDS